MDILKFYAPPYKIMEELKICLKQVISSPLIPIFPNKVKVYPLPIFRLQ